jgi:hypothetical protein
MNGTRLRPSRFHDYGVADDQMKRDIADGKLDDVLREVEEDIKAGRLREMQ